MKSILPNTSIVCVVRNRNEILADSLANWLQFGVPEIVIVDFRDGSCEQARSVVDTAGDARIRLIETVYEYHFHRTVAWNLALSQASFPFMLKLDVDYLLTNDFFERNSVDESSFISGYYGDCLESLTGLLYIHRDQFEQINGFHERMFYYGREDVDVSDRLAVHYERKPFALGSVVHKSHSDTMRLQSWGRCSPERERSILMAGLKLNEWIEKAAPWDEHCRRTQWRLETTDGMHSIAVRIF